MSDGKTTDPSSRFAGFEAIPLQVTVLVGRARCTLARLTKLEVGDVIRLDRRVGEPFDLRVEQSAVGGVEPVAAESGIDLKLVAVVEDDHAGNA